MFWTDRIELIISLSLLLIVFPCLVAYSFKPLPKGVSTQIGILVSGIDVLAAEIVILLLLALYFACLQHKTKLPSALAFSKCTKTTYQSQVIAAAQYSSNPNQDQKQISKENQSIVWQIMSKQEVIFN